MDKYLSHQIEKCKNKKVSHHKQCIDITKVYFAFQKQQDAKEKPNEYRSKEIRLLDVSM